jgi:HPt (histidine-containing phosphotransfer) domain-containing protein
VAGDGGSESGGGTSDPAFDRELAALREAFGRKLPARIEEVAAALDAARGSRPRGEACLVARRLAHNLHGTAASYGFASVGAEMEQVVDALDALADSSGADLDGLWSSIERALAQARARPD